MNQNPNAVSPTAAADMLLWLQSMGADEVIAAEPIDRYQEKPPAPRVVVPPPLPVARAVAPTAKPVIVVETGDMAARVAAATTLGELAALLDQFDDHPLKKTATRHCFVGGATEARVLLISDRPRNEEDRSGQVFAGKHDVLAERMLAAIGLRGLAQETAREPVALASFLPWRPPGNRPPTDLECQMALPFIRHAVQLIRPRMILAFGHLPGQWLAGAPGSITSQRGKWLMLDGVSMMTTFHPESLLKSPALKRLAWLDLLAFRQRLEQTP